MYCTRHTSDLEIAQEIWLMTAITHGLNIEGQKMLQNGLSIKDNMFMLCNFFAECDEMIETASSDDHADMNTTVEMSDEG